MPEAALVGMNMTVRTPGPEDLDDRSDERLQVEALHVNDQRRVD
jgi:hypothetical protein